jgi:hypothetical protein
MTPRTIGAPPSTPIDTESHLSILALLPEYVAILVVDQQPPAAWRPLEQHLKRCAACRSEAESLLQQMVETYSGTLPAAPATPPPPSLPFLTRRSALPVAPATPPPRPSPAAHAPAPLAYQVQISAALLSHMRVHMAARAGELRLRYSYTFPTYTSSDPTITLEILSADDQASHGLARICVEHPDRNPFEQAGTQVTLSGDGIALNGLTDQSGIVIFQGVPLDAIASWQIDVSPSAGPPGDA